MVSEVSEIVSLNAENIWMKASIPIVSHKRVLQLVGSYHEKYKNLLKSFKGRQNSTKYKSALNSFCVSSKNALFDISTCKCSEFTTCNCEKFRKVPVDEQAFLTDQRIIRNMLIGKVDNIATKRLHRQLKRKAAADLRVTRNKKSNEEAEDGDGDLPGHGSSTSSDWKIDDDLPLARMITIEK